MAQQKIQGSDWQQKVNLNFDELYAAGAGSTASATQKGPVELATNAEAYAGTDTERALTPANLLAVNAKVVVWAFAGKNGAGACTLTGAKVGDVVESITGVVAAKVGNQAADFETTISVNDQIQQTAVGDLSTYIYHVRLLRKS